MNLPFVAKTLQGGECRLKHRRKKKNPMDMTLAELYKALVESNRKALALLKSNRKDRLAYHRKETGKQDEHQKEQISKKIDTAENMLKALNLCVS